MTKKPNLKKEARNNRADALTMDMKVPSGVCGSEGDRCPNPPAFAIGSLRFCASCLEHVRASYPASFTAYWESKVTPLNVR